MGGYSMEQQQLFLDNKITILPSDILCCTCCQRYFYCLHNTLQHINSRKHVARLKHQKANASINSNNDTEDIKENCKAYEKVQMAEVNMEKFPKYLNNEIYDNTFDIVPATKSATKWVHLDVNESHETAKMDNDVILSSNICAQIRQELCKNPFFFKDKSPIQEKPEIAKPVAQRLNKKYHKIYYELEEKMYSHKFDNLKSSFKFFIPYKKTDLYCLACNTIFKTNLQSLCEHSCHITHLVQLKNVIMDQNKNALTGHYMKVLSNEAIKCYACNSNIDNNLTKIVIHLNSDIHQQNYDKLREIMSKIQSSMIKDINECWYYIQRYCCILCRVTYKYKMEFLEHVVVKHKRLYLDNYVFDFCVSCTTLWLDKVESYVTHCNDIMHKYVLKTEHFKIDDLPKSAKDLVLNADESIDTLYELTEEVLHNDEMPKKAIKSLEDSLRRGYPKLKLYVFGSRVNGLGLPNSDIDIFIDFDGTGYNKEKTHFEKRPSAIIKKLCRQNNQWEIKDILEKSRTPLIRLKHRQMNLDCDITFANGLSVENSKLIRSFNDACLPCRKLTLFLKKWLSLSNLSRKHSITNYALAWMVIFFLQVETYLPSISELIKIQAKSQRIGAWEVGVAQPTCNYTPTKTVRQLLLQLFLFYGNFDYKYNVICPFMGHPVAKKAFAEPNELPDAMYPYINYIETSPNPEYFRIDSSMCVQDPFDLSHNLTKAVDTIVLNCFKKYCQESALILIADTVAQKK